MHVALPHDEVKQASQPSSLPAKFMDEKQLCAELGIASVTAAKWRARAAGPPFIKVGRLVRYRRSDVEAWLRSRTCGRAA